MGGQYFRVLVVDKLNSEGAIMTGTWELLPTNSRHPWVHNSDGDHAAASVYLAMSWVRSNMDKLQTRYGPYKVCSGMSP